MEWMPFNLNDKIKVRLKTKGYQLLADQHNELAKRVPSFRKRDAAYYERRADSQGYTEFQAWSFLEQFGPVSGLGHAEYYYLNIQISITQPT